MQRADQNPNVGLVVTAPALCRLTCPFGHDAWLMSRGPGFAGPAYPHAYDPESAVSQRKWKESFAFAISAQEFAADEKATAVIPLS